VSREVVSFELNGEPVAALAGPLASLQSVLREELGMTGTKAGCRQGGCGSCTVRVDGAPVLSCLVPVAHVAGRDVHTVEGLGSLDELSPLQVAFYEGFAIQCGFCAPGMLAVAEALLERHPEPTREQIVEALAGNVCRCTGIGAIVDAVETAAVRRSEPVGVGG
jgi:aerobic carbon-monoxide dehydrogenase small subunit